MKTLKKILTEKQLSLAKMYARKADLDEQMIIDWLEWWKVTFSELSQGILGTDYALWEL